MNNVISPEKVQAHIHEEYLFWAKTLEEAIGSYVPWSLAPIFGVVEEGVSEALNISIRYGVCLQVAEEWYWEISIIKV